VLENTPRTSDTARGFEIPLTNRNGSVDSGALVPSPRLLDLISSRPSRARVTGKTASKKAKPHPDHHAGTVVKAYLSLRLHTHHLAILHDDVIHRFVQHVCPSIDGTQSCKALGQLTKAVKWV